MEHPVYHKACFWLCYSVYYCKTLQLAEKKMCVYVNVLKLYQFPKQLKNKSSLMSSELIPWPFFFFHFLLLPIKRHFVNIFLSKLPCPTEIEF